MKLVFDFETVLICEAFKIEIIYCGFKNCGQPPPQGVASTWPGVKHGAFTGLLNSPGLGWDFVGLGLARPGLGCKQSINYTLMLEELKNEA